MTLMQHMVSASDSREIQTSSLFSAVCHSLLSPNPQLRGVVFPVHLEICDV